MDDLFHEMTETLREASRGVREDIERSSKSSGEDVDGLTRLLQAIRSFAGQSDSLLMMMIERDPLNAEIAKVEDLLQVFRQAELQVVRQLEVGRG